MRIEDIEENKFYCYITSNNKDYFFFNHSDEQTIWVTAFNINSDSPPGFISHKPSQNMVHEKFWINRRGFHNEVYSQGWEAKEEDKMQLIKYIFELRLLTRK